MSIFAPLVDSSDLALRQIGIAVQTVPPGITTTWEESFSRWTATPPEVLPLGWRCPSCGRGCAPTEKTCDHGVIPEPTVTPTEDNQTKETPHFDEWE